MQAESITKGIRHTEVAIGMTTALVGFQRIYKPSLLDCLNFSEKLQLRGFYIKAFAMVFAQSELLNCLAVFFSGVAFVGIPAVVRKFLVQLPHVIIAICLREYARGGNGRIFRVSFNDTLVTQLLVSIKPIAIYE